MAPNPANVGGVTALTPGDVPVTLVNGATGTGTAKSAQFTVALKEGRAEARLNVHGRGSTTLAVQLQSSSDGGGSFVNYAAATSELIANGDQQIAGLVPGLVYLLNVTTLTGAAGSVDCALA